MLPVKSRETRVARNSSEGEAGGAGPLSVWCTETYGRKMSSESLPLHRKPLQKIIQPQLARLPPAFPPRSRAGVSCQALGPPPAVGLTGAQARTASTVPGQSFSSGLRCDLSHLDGLSIVPLNPSCSTKKSRAGALPGSPARRTLELPGARAWRGDPQATPGALLPGRRTP